MGRRPVLFLACSIVLLLRVAWVLAQDAPRVEVFSPQGTVKGVRQVAARFSEQMVAFGEPRLVEPFDIQCPVEGAARWADARNWVYDFDSDLPAGIECTFTLKPDLKTLNGQLVTGESGYTFSTGGPAIMQSMPYEGNTGIDEGQIFILGLDAPATKESIEQNVYCDVSGIAEQVGVRLVEGDERKAVLDQRRDFLDQYFRLLFEDSDRRIWIYTARAPLTGTNREKFLKLRDSEESPIVVLQCQRRFPPNVDMKLLWGKGVTSTSGVATPEDQTLAFHVRDEFRASFSCERVNKDADCIPVLPMYLSFSAPIARAQAEKIILQPEEGEPYHPMFPEDYKEDYVHGVTFTGPFPERAAFEFRLPEGLQDDAGRALVNQDHFPLTVRTDEAPPLVKFPAQFGIIELHADAMLPVTARNLEAAVPLPPLPRSSEQLPGMDSLPDAPTAADGIVDESWYRRWYHTLRERYWPEATEINGRTLRAGDANEIIGWMRNVRESQQAKGHYDWEADKWIVEHRPGEKSLFDTEDKVETFKLSKPEGKRAFEVIGIPFEEPGFFVVEIASPRLGAALYGKQAPYHAQTSVLVTNLAAHFKRGRESSLVWVTTLDKARPVADAEVKVSDCGGTVHFEGRTDKGGLLRIDQPLPPEHELPECLDYTRAYFVTARAGDDMTFVLSSWNEGIALWRFGVPTANYETPNLVSTVFDRTLLRAGETVHMKHIARRHSRAGFDIVGQNELPKQAVVRHQGSDQEYELSLSWDAQGIAESIWDVPKDAKQGTYTVNISTQDPERGEININAGSFRIETYRVPTMKAVLQPTQSDHVDARQAEVDIQVNFLSGGGASGAEVKLRALVQPKSVYFPDYEDFTLANGNVKEGRERPGLDVWQVGGYDWEEPGTPAGPHGSKPLATQTLQLDRAGAARATLSDLPKAGTAQSVLAELEYRDASGEVLTTATRINLWPASVIVGLKPDAWAVSKDNLKFQALALDLKGKPIRGAKVKIDLLQRLTYSHRKRLVGGFYAYEHESEVKRVHDLCAGETDEKGLLFCETRSPLDGNLILRAQVADEAGNVSYANREVWVAKSGDWWFDVGNEDRMDVLPEKKRYEPGDTAVFQVRMPFREATALVGVEREGVMETFVQPLSGKSPVVKIPIKRHYAPNVFVSVLAVRGRVDDVQPAALVDLGKPAYKLGIAEIKVGWQAHELKVNVAADRDAYRVRERALVRVKVARANGEALPEEAAIALAAVDEGLLELKPNESWKLLEAMMGRRGMEVETSTAQMQVIGRRHYGRKALPHGGGGGRQSGRELFDTLLLWRGRVKLDANGEAIIEVPLNDSLTSFRIVAVANAGSGLFGTGSTSIRSTQQLMLLTGLPPLVREQDRFRAGFTVRNASTQAMDGVEVTATAMQIAGAEKPKALDSTLTPITLSLAAGEAQEIGWDVSVPLDAEKLSWEIAATAPSGAADLLKVTQKVIPAVRVRTWQATLLQLDRPFDMKAEIPGDAIPGRGGMRVTLKRSLGDELAGVRDFMRYYPYTCLEQRVSQAIALRDAAQWKGIMNDLPSYLDPDGLAKYFPVLYRGEDALTAYVLAIAHEAAYEIPEDLRNRMREGLIKFVKGQITRGSALPTADLSIRKMAALEAASRYEVIDPTLLSSINIEPNLWPTSAVIDWTNVVARTDQIERRQERMEEAQQIIRSRLNFQGTTMGFSTERDDYLWWLMVSADSNANRAILSLLDATQWQQDLPRMVRGSLGRQRRGHWSTTVANAWGVLAMEKFGKKFESEAVTGVTRSRLGGQQEWNWTARPAGGSLYHPWPTGIETLALGHQGGGRPWAMIQSLVAVPLREAFSSGYKIVRTVTSIEQKQQGQWSRGDVARVRLELEAQSDMTWVVVNDPIPAGASILGTGLGKDSQILTQGEQRQGYVWPAFEERAFDSFRAYYGYVPKGRWVAEYTVRFNNAGHFELPETRVEALYAPEMFGEIPNAPVIVNP
ncbi:MAG: alpha-2-macroglobulin family protein [Chromatiales bacterium]